MEKYTMSKAVRLDGTKAQAEPPNLTGIEICIGPDCGIDTGIPKACDIGDPRRMGNYVEGAGQLCPSCARKIYGGVRLSV